MKLQDESKKLTVDVTSKACILL